MLATGRSNSVFRFLYRNPCCTFQILNQSRDNLTTAACITCFNIRTARCWCLKTSLQDSHSVCKLCTELKWGKVWARFAVGFNKMTSANCSYGYLGLVTEANQENQSISGIMFLKSNISYTNIQNFDLTGDRSIFWSTDRFFWIPVYYRTDIKPHFMARFSKSCGKNWRPQSWLYQHTVNRLIDKPDVSTDLSTQGARILSQKINASDIYLASLLRSRTIRKDSEVCTLCHTVSCEGNSRLFCSGILDCKYECTSRRARHYKIANDACKYPIKNTNFEFENRFTYAQNPRKVKSLIRTTNRRESLIQAGQLYLLRTAFTVTSHEKPRRRSFETDQNKFQLQTFQPYRVVCVQKIRWRKKSMTNHVWYQLVGQTTHQYQQLTTKTTLLSTLWINLCSSLRNFTAICCWQKPQSERSSHRTRLWRRPNYLAHWKTYTCKVSLKIVSVRSRV